MPGATPGTSGTTQPAEGPGVRLLAESPGANSGRRSSALAPASSEVTSRPAEGDERFAGVNNAAPTASALGGGPVTFSRWDRSSRRAAGRALVLFEDFDRAPRVSGTIAPRNCGRDARPRHLTLGLIAGGRRPGHGWSPPPRTLVRKIDKPCPERVPSPVDTPSKTRRTSRRSLENLLSILRWAAPQAFKMSP